MSVYTPISAEALDTLLTDYDLGQLSSFEGINAGIENTNYFVTTQREDGIQSRYILTLFEQMQHSEVPYFLELMAYLSDYGVPSAHPIADQERHYLREFCGKPMTIVECLTGSEVKTPNVAQCRALGAAMGHMHTASPSFPLYRANTCGAAWREQVAERVKPYLNGEQRFLLEDELRHQNGFQDTDLPRGVIHADLFRDNALFIDDKLSGIIDFYYACDDLLLYDVAVTVNDWCTTETGHLDSQRLQAWLSAYQQKRPFTEEEQQAWPTLLRMAALRFWLSRLQDKYFPRLGELTHIKDPDVFKNMLLAQRDLAADCLLPIAT